MLFCVMGFFLIHRYDRREAIELESFALSLGTGSLAAAHSLRHERSANCSRRINLVL